MSHDTPSGITSKHHLFIFWGFLVITIGSTEFILNGLIPAFSFRAIGLGPVATGLYWMIDLFNLIVLCMLGYALFRRVVLKPRLIPMSLDAGLILCRSASSRSATSRCTVADRQPAPVLRPGVGCRWLSMSSLPAGTLHAIATAAGYWTHAFILLFFLNYLPHSSTSILGSLPNIYLRNLDQRGVMPKLNLDDDNDWGVNKIEGSRGSRSSISTPVPSARAARTSARPTTPKSRCRRCTSSTTSGRDGGATKAMLAKASAAPAAEKGEAKEGSEGRGELPPLIGGRIKEETLWACTTCGACQEVCPVFIDHPLKIQQMKTSLVLNGEGIPVELQRTFQNLERRGNPGGRR